MRIGLFTDAYLPQVSGVASSTAMLHQALRARGHESFVITPRDPDQTHDDADVFRVPSVPFLSEKRFTLGQHPVMKKRLTALKLDIVHSQTEFGMGTFARAVASELGVPHIHTFHTFYDDWISNQVRAKEGSLSWHLIRWSVKKAIGRFCASVDRVIAPTDKAHAVLARYGVKCPVAIIPTGLDLALFQDVKQSESAHAIRLAHGYDDNVKLLLYLGRVSNEKEIDHALIYLEPLLKARNDLRVLIVGEGPAEDKLKRWVDAHNLAAIVTFNGPVPWREVPAYYRAADLFFSASRSETQGLTYIEALACGTPILVREDKALETVIQPGTNGYAFRDAATCQSHLNAWLALDDDAREAMKRQAAASVERFSVDTFVNDVLALYRDAMAAPKRKRRRPHRITRTQRTKR